LPGDGVEGDWPAGRIEPAKCFDGLFAGVFGATACGGA
jgi:hypothetical protein